MIDYPVIIIGAGGHAKVLIDSLMKQSIDIIGVTDKDLSLKGTDILGVKVLGDDQAVDYYSAQEIRLVNGIGSSSRTEFRKELFLHFKQKGYHFANVIHPSAIIGTDVSLAEGAQVMAGAIIQPNTSIGKNSIINTKASIDHDSFIGDHVHIAPGSTLSGGVIIEDEVHIGTSATIIQNIRVGKGSLVGAGAVVIRNVNTNSKVIGVPAKEV